MAVNRGKLEKNLAGIRETIAAACDRAGRSPSEVSIVAVTKSADVETIRNLIDIGQTELGESRVQQLTERAAEVSAWLDRRRGEPRPPVRWHLVGHLQRNKVRNVLDVIDVIHSVDSLRLAEEINLRAERLGRIADALLQVNCSEEQQKFGCAVGAVVTLGEMVASMKHVRLLGLMTMAQLTDRPETARPVFVRLRELFEEMRGQRIGGEHFRHLSMGMSQDYAVAVQEGATMLRIGTALLE